MSRANQRRNIFYNIHMVRPGYLSDEKMLSTSQLVHQIVDDLSTKKIIDCTSCNLHALSADRTRVIDLSPQPEQ